MLIIYIIKACCFSTNYIFSFKELNNVLCKKLLQPPIPRNFRVINCTEVPEMSTAELRRRKADLHPHLAELLLPLYLTP